MPQSEPESGPWERYATQDQNGAEAPKPISEQQATAAKMPSWEDITQSLMPGHPTLAKAAGYLGDVFQGAGTEAGEQLGRLTSYVSPRGGQALQPIINRVTPRVDAPGEGLGRAALDAGEFFIPGGAEAESGKVLGEATSVLPKIVSEGARLLPGAASAGGINALQGGSFGTGAALGEGFGAASRIGESVAPKLMQRAIGVTRRQLSYGAKPGEEALQLSGMRPGTVSQSAAAAAQLHTQQLRQMLRDAEQQGVMVNLDPARQALDQEIRAATRRSSRPVLTKLQQLQEQLNEMPDGRLIGGSVSPVQARELKQGLDDTIGAWEKDSEGTPKRVRDAAKRARRMIDRETDRVIPGHKELNDKLAGLLSAAKPKGRPQGIFGRGIGGQFVGRVAVPSLGYFEARERGMSPLQAGALAASLEALNSPTAAIGAARALNSPITAPLLRGLTLGTYHGMTPTLRPGSILPSMLPQFRAPQDPNAMPKPLQRKSLDVRGGG